VMKQFCDANGIDHRVTAAYHPQSNGATERLNQTIKNGLRKSLEGKKKEWPKHVNRVLFGIRIHRPRSTKQSPYKLLYGFDARCSFDNDLERLNEVPEEDVEYDEAVEEERMQRFLEGVEKREEDQLKNRTEARAHIKVEQAIQKEAFDTKKKPKPFKVGNKILLQNSRKLTRVAEELESHFTGPYFIDRITKGNTCYLIRTGTLTALRKPVSAARLKLFIEKPGVKVHHYYEHDDNSDNFDTDDGDCSSSDESDLEPPNKTPRLSAPASDAAGDESVSSKDIELLSAPTINYEARFKPPTKAFMTVKCASLNINKITRPRFGTPRVFNRIVHPEKKNIKKIVADGNCLFRCFSYCLTGKEDHHVLLRSTLCDYMGNDPKTWNRVVCGNITEYLSHGLRTPGSAHIHWGTENEIFAFADMFNCKVYVFNDSEALPLHTRAWTGYSPQLRDGRQSLDDFGDLTTIMLYANHDHFEICMAP
jgi:hypothetical protein